MSTNSYRKEVEDDASEPIRLGDDGLWVQFESTYPLKLMPWMVGHESEDGSFLKNYAAYSPKAEIPKS